MYLENDIYQSDIKRIISTDWKELKDKSVLITGASGLVGSFLVDTLVYLNENYNYGITIYATFSGQHTLDERFGNYKRYDFFKPLIKDINTPFKYDFKPDYIIHAASNTHPALYANNPVETIKLNILGTSNVLDFAKNAKAKKVIFLSTLEVYGEDPSIESFAEDHIGYVNFLTPRSCYPVSKRAAESLCMGYITEYGLDISIARLGYIYGPTVKLNSSKADVQFLNKALTNEDIILRSQGTQRRSYCYVADTVAGIIWCALKGASGEAYNVASENGNICLKDYANIIAEIAGVNVKYDVPTDVEIQGGCKVQNSTLNSRKLQQLGWKPLFDIKEGIAHTYEIKKYLKN